MSAEHHPLAGVPDETIYRVLNGDRASQSWFDKCNALEAALVKAGWQAPAGHPLAAPPPAMDDLLKAAKRALNVLKASGESVRPTNALGALDAAIAKAEGR
jgi:hypothetical protein